MTQPGVMIRPRFPKPYADRVARLRVPSGFVLVAAFAWLAAPTPLSLAYGAPIGLSGLLLRAWAAGHLAKNESLATGGPYAYIRNPLYAGTLFVATGLVVAARRWELALLFAVVFAFVYLPVIELEEQHLRKLFPEYANYAASVPLLLPHIGARCGTEAFRFRLYLKNQEYQALFGYLVGLTYLVWKAVG